MKRGDLFEVKVEDGSVIYFQSLGRDPEQLNSDVIRVFRRRLKTESSWVDQDIDSWEINFHAHVVLGIGTRTKVWKRIGMASIREGIVPIFRISGDYGNAAVKISNDWWVWRLGSEMERVGKLFGKWRSAEVGIVVRPGDVISRSINGSYSFFYPGYK